MNAPLFPHSRRFDIEQSEIAVALSALGGRVEANLAAALDAAARDDASADRRIWLEGEEIARRTEALELRVTQLIALRQPVATDLRALLCAIRIAGALRRTAELTRSLTPPQDHARAADPARDAALRLGQEAARQLSEALDAWQRRDLPAARAVWRRETRIDAHFDAALAVAGEAMRASPAAVRPAARWLMICRALERISDLAAEIAAATWRRDSTAPLTQG